MYSGLRKVDFDLSSAGFVLKPSARAKLQTICKQYAGPMYVSSLAICCGYVEKIPKANVEKFVQELTNLLTDPDNLEPVRTEIFAFSETSTLENQFRATGERSDV
jgi:hypothetical protein